MADDFLLICAGQGRLDGAFHHAGIRAAVICVTLLNRLNGDQVGSH